MKKKLILTLGVSIVFMVSLCRLYSFFNCYLWTCPPKRNFTIHDLVLPEEFYPGGARIIPFTDDTGTPQLVEEGDGGARWTNGNAMLTIDRNASDKYATEEYSFYERLHDKYTYPINENSCGSEIYNFSSPNADQQKIICGYERDQILFMARYEEYYVQFFSTIDTNMTEEQFLTAVKYLDSTLIKFLYGQ